MTARILRGTETSALIRDELRDRVTTLREHGIVPALGVVLVGEDPASVSYVTAKAKGAAEVGIDEETIRLREATSETDVLEVVRQLNGDPRFHGLLVQLPLPKHLDERAILEAVDPRKDVDGFTFANIGRLVENCPQFVPCTPAGIIEILDREGIEIKGKHAVVVGRSEIVGKPVAFLLLHRHATVTICHSRTADLSAETRRADILVAAVGRPRLITGAMLKPGAVVIDVGINRVEGKLVGDVDFESAVQVASAITPVPGGVGPMTVALLLKNTVRACELAPS